MENTVLKKADVEVMIDDLAVMIAKGFAGMEEKFDKKIDALDIRLSGRIDSLEGKIDELDQRLTGRINSLEQKVDRMDTRLTNQLDNVLLTYTRREEHIFLSGRVKKVERKLRMA